MEVIPGIVPSTPVCRGDLTGEPLDMEEVQKARKLEIEYFR